MPKTIAIIPARGGSKRIPRKNIKSFLGKPIIAYSIEAALRSGLFTEVMVSTDDAEISKYARAAGATVPFMRDPTTATDHAGLSEVVLEVIAEYEKRGTTVTQACCILPTAPFITLERLKAGHALLIEKKFSSVYPIVQFSYPIMRSLKFENGKISMLWPEHFATRSQDLPPAYHDAGQWYWLDASQFKKAGKLLTDNTGAIELPEQEVQDIDTEQDWILAELKYTFMKNNQGGSSL